jgi:hypothetical protein
MTPKELKRIKERIRRLVEGPVKEDEIANLQAQVIFKDCPAMIAALEDKV